MKEIILSLFTFFFISIVSGIAIFAIYIYTTEILYMVFKILHKLAEYITTKRDGIEMAIAIIAAIIFISLLIISKVNTGSFLGI